jgi:hypothetical protein
MEKTFKGDFEKFRDKLKNGENFGFSRFSDGELFVLQNKVLELNENNYVIGDQVGNGWYNKEEQKTFHPKEHKFFRNKLIDSLQFNKNNYYKGISCKCCVGQDSFDWQIDLSGSDEESLTWANLWNNGNYERFMTEIVPIFNEKEVILIVNESAILDNLSFNIKKDFRVGTNCFINDYGLIEELKEYIQKNNIKNHVFLVSCASLSNLIVHQLFEFDDNNTYIDIGSTLNPMFKMEGWKGSRGYLKEYWLGQPRFYLDKNCIW